MNYLDTIEFIKQNAEEHKDNVSQTAVEILISGYTKLNLNVELNLDEFLALNVYQNKSQLNFHHVIAHINEVLITHC